MIPMRFFWIHRSHSQHRLDRAQARLADEELAERKARLAEDKPALAQPTVGLMFRKLLAKRHPED